MSPSQCLCLSVSVSQSLCHTENYRGTTHGQSPTILKIVIHHSKDSHPPSPEWSAIIHKKITLYPHNDYSQSSGMPPTNHRIVTPHVKDSHNSPPPIQRWLHIIPRIVTQHPNGDQPPSYRTGITTLLESYQIK